MTNTNTPARVRRRLLAVGLRRSPDCPEERRLREQVKWARWELGQYRPPRARLATPSPTRPKPRLTLEQAREQAARWAAMHWAPDRPEDPDA